MEVSFQKGLFCEGMALVDETWVQVMVMMKLQKSFMKALRNCEVMIHRIVIMTTDNFTLRNGGGDTPENCDDGQW